MSTSNPFEEILSVILRDYFATFPEVEPTIPDIHIVPDMLKEYSALRPDLLQQHSDVDDLNRSNGVMVAPQRVGGTFTVVINKNILIENIKNNRMDWVGTVAHEMTHVQDFVLYAQIVAIEEYEEIIRIDAHGMFNLWTEIHARARGYYFTRKYTLSEKLMKSELLLPDIMGREIPTQLDMLLERYNATSNSYERAYNAAQYLGRLYTLQQLYPDAFNDNWIRSHFGANKWMFDWFMFYKQYPTLELASNNFDEMKRILSFQFCEL